MQTFLKMSLLIFLISPVTVNCSESPIDTKLKNCVVDILAPFDTNYLSWKQIQRVVSWCEINYETY